MDFAFQVTVRGTRSVRLVSQLDDVRRQLWTVLKAGGVLDWVKAGRHSFNRREVVSLVESVIAGAPRPIPAAVAIGVAHALNLREISR